jgi:hypothetical protein
MQAAVDPDLDFQSKRKVREIERRSRRLIRLQRAKEFGFSQSVTERLVFLSFRSSLSLTLSLCLYRMIKIQNIMKNSLSTEDRSNPELYTN